MSVSLPFSRRAAPSAQPPRLRHLFNNLRISVLGFWAHWRRGALRAHPTLIWRRAALFAAFVAGLFALAFLADVKGALWARTLAPFIVEIFAWITLIGSAGYIVVISLGLTLLCALGFDRLARERQIAGLILLGQRAFFVFCAIAVSGVFGQIFKHALGRARPRLFDQFGAFHFDFLSIKATLASMPSGHTTTAFALAMTLALIAPRWRIALFFVAACVGLSRVIVGAHYPSDVFAGACLGMASALGVARAFAARRMVFDFVNGRLAARSRGLCKPALLALLSRGRSA